MSQEDSGQHPSIQPAFFTLSLQQGGALAPVLWAMHVGALLLGLGVAACAAMSGMAAAMIVATMSTVARMVRVNFCMLVFTSLISTSRHNGVINMFCIKP